ncbi:hypothetical protein M422DRAFT_53347 [Sphaerobolus stellatus SS14]|uniref:Uncharacterized protein n=1 Tax=Sphaerobolus stellatus (strain SS14) TaxID=990650 RepID=A0A0C9TNF3_SPHS4|nr:hypothetical protein M422DRAFT_53347 [Sphaerobolus stellatus SS14]
MGYWPFSSYSARWDVLLVQPLRVTARRTNWFIYGAVSRIPHRFITLAFRTAYASRPPHSSHHSRASQASTILGFMASLDSAPPTYVGHDIPSTSHFWHAGDVSVSSSCISLSEPSTPVDPHIRRTIHSLAGLDDPRSLRNHSTPFTYVGHDIPTTPCSSLPHDDIIASVSPRSTSLSERPTPIDTRIRHTIASLAGLDDPRVYGLAGFCNNESAAYTYVGDIPSLPTLVSSSTTPTSSVDDYDRPRNIYFDDWDHHLAIDCSHGVI